MSIEPLPLVQRWKLGTPPTGIDPWLVRRLLALERTLDLIQQRAEDPTTGTWTPTLTNVVNLDASTASLCSYVRIQDSVVFAGKLQADPTAAASVQLGISLPIASDFAAEEDCCGSGAARAVAGLSVAIQADTTNNRMEMRWIAADVANRTIFFSGIYRIL